MVSPEAEPARAQPDSLTAPSDGRRKTAGSEFAGARAAEEAMHPLNERGLRRWKIYVLGSVVFFPLMTWVLSPAGFGMLWLQLIVAALYGTFLAFARPTGIVASLATLLAGVTTQAIAGTPTDHFSRLLFTLGLFMYATFGFILGMTQQAAYMNGE